jgi:peroxiredoxin
MVELGTAMPAFLLRDVRTDAMVSSDALGGRAFVVIFLCNHCPYVKRIADGLAAFGADLAAEDVAVVGISANDPEEYPEDAPAELARVADEQGYAFPVLFDADQAVARAFGAACTPDFFVYDAERRLAYRGQFDRARPGNGEPVTGADVRAAVQALLDGRPVPEPQVPSLGCSIKWRSEGLGLSPRWR